MPIIDLNREQIPGLELQAEASGTKQETTPLHGKFISIGQERYQYGKPKNYHIMPHDTLGHARSRLGQLRGGGMIYRVDHDKLTFVEHYGA